MRHMIDIKKNSSNLKLHVLHVQLIIGSVQKKKLSDLKLHVTTSTIYYK